MSITLGSLAVGSKIKIPHSKMGDIIFLKADKDHADYPANSTTLITEKIILLRCFDAKEPNNADSNRINNGNNKYSVSNIDLWLNSEAAEGQWYTPRHDADQAPDSTSVTNYNAYANDAGFLNGFNTAFVAALMDTTLKVALNTVTDGGSYETIVRKFFLASKAEVFGQAENSITEGSLLSLFSANTNDCRIAYVSDYAAANSDYSVSAGAARIWWLRTPDSSNSCYVRGVSSGGGLNGNFACGGYRGVRPLCNLSSDILVSESVDGDGCYVLELGEGGASISTPTISVQEEIYCEPTNETGGIVGGIAAISWTKVNNASEYVLERSVNGGTFVEIYRGNELTYVDSVTQDTQTLQYRIKASDGNGLESDYSTSETRVVLDNYPPFISGDNSNLGEVLYDFSYNYAVYDGDDINITVKEYLNSTLLREYSAASGVQNTLSLTNEQWAELPAGDNYIKIVVIDDNGSTVTQTKHFTKAAGILEIEYSPTGDILIKPSIINVELDLDMPFKSILKVEACNNRNDRLPVWDDITTAVKSRLNHVFSNNAKEQGVSYWKVAIRVTVQRNNAVGEINLRGLKCQLNCTVE